MNSYATVPPTLADHAAMVEADLENQRCAWDRGFTRRTFLRGAGMVGVAALGAQLVTTKAAFAAPAAGNGNTVINIFLRGAADGLRMLLPASSALGLDYLVGVRPDLVPASGDLIGLANSGGWAMNTNLAPLAPYWASGELAFVPAVSSSGISRSHFDAQRFIDLGGVPTSSNGWMDRLIGKLGPGTTFRALSDGGALPASMFGPQAKLAISTLNNFTYPAPTGSEARTADAIQALYRGMPGAAPQAITEALSALAAVTPMRAANRPQNGARYPWGSLAQSLADIATMLRGEVGLQVVAIDVGGWDTHTKEVQFLDPQINQLASALAAFMQDLGPARRSRVTLCITTEFGRRVAQNAAAGSDHGHGSVMLVLGGGLKKAQVAGKWQQLSDATLDQGDVQGLNDPFQVYSEMAKRRLGLANTKAVFPGVTYSPLGVFA